MQPDLLYRPLIQSVRFNKMMHIYKPKMASVFFAGLFCVILASCMVFISIQRDGSLFLFFERNLPYATL